MGVMLSRSPRRILKKIGEHDVIPNRVTNPTSEGLEQTLLHLKDALEKALEDSKTCVVFVGPDGLGDWHEEEMDT